MILDKPDIILVAESLGCKPDQKSGSRFYGGNCPGGHSSEGERCLNIYTDTQSFYCFQCGAGGDVYNLIQSKLNCDFVGALQWSKDKGFISGNGDNSHKTFKARPTIKKDDLQFSMILTEASRFFHSNLSDDFRKHLKSYYGLTDKIIDQHKIGYAPTDPQALTNHLKQYFTIDQIKKSGLLTKKNQSFFQGQIIFPYWKNGFVRYAIARQTDKTPSWKNGKYEKLPLHDPESRPFISESIQNNIFYGEDSVIKDRPYLYIAEGVTDCLALLQNNFPCVSPVTVQFRQSDIPKIIELAKSKRVVLIPDNEVNGAGLKGAETTLEQLKAKSIDAHIILIPRPDNADKIDLNEYIRNNGIEAFKKLVKEQTPPVLEDIIFTAEAFTQLDIPEKSTFLDPWLKEKTYGMIYGDRGKGKSILILSILDALTWAQKQFGPWQIKESVNCLYLDGEMVASDIIERLQGFGIKNRKSKLFIYNNEFANLAGLPNANLLNKQWREQIRRFLIKNDIKLWVVDNLSSLASGIDENTKHEFDPINQFFIQLRYDGISTLIVHHTNKSGDQRGSIGKEDNMDYSIQLKSPGDYSPEQGARFICHFTKARIKNDDLKKISDCEFQLTTNEYNQYEWRYKNVVEDKRRQIACLLNDGVAAKDIAQEIGVSPAYISKVKRQLIKAGLLTSKCKFTDLGCQTFG